MAGRDLRQGIRTLQEPTAFLTNDDTSLPSPADHRLPSVLFACSSDTGGPVIRGQLGQRPEHDTTFQRIGESGEVTLDSVTTDADRKFSFRNPVTELDYYILRANPTNLLFSF